MTAPGPDFIVIGAMKCATSTLHDQLSRQPGLFMSSPKEPCFFSDDAVFARGIEWYQALFEAAPAGAIRGESSTHYSKLPTYPHTVDRLSRHVPAARFIYVMRHPIDRLISHYVHEWTMRTLSMPIDEAAESFAPLVDYGRYGMQIGPFLDRFGEERVLPVFHERLVSHPQEELERVARFIGLRTAVKWNETIEARNVGAQRMRRSPLRDAILELPLLRQARRMFVPRTLRERVKRLWMLQDKPALSPDVFARLERVFDADLARLGRRLGLSMTCATWKQIVSGGSPAWVRPERSVEAVPA